MKFNKPKKLTLFGILSYAVIISFVFMVIFELIPQKSREGLPTSEPTAAPSLTQTPSDTNIYITPEPTLPKYHNITLTGDITEKTITLDGIDVGKISYHVPRVIYPDFPDAEKKINEVISKEALTHIDNFEQECYFLSMDFDPSLPPFQFTGASLIYTSRDIISIKMTVQIQYHSPQKELSVICFNFDPETGKTVELNNLDIDTELLAKRLIEKTRIINDYVFSDGSDLFIKENILNTLWYKNGEEIVFVYLPYEITPGIYGAVELSVPFEGLEKTE